MFTPRRPNTRRASPEVRPPICCPVNRLTPNAIRPPTASTMAGPVISKRKSPTVTGYEPIAPARIGPAAIVNSSTIRTEDMTNANTRPRS